MIIWYNQIESIIERVIQLSELSISQLRQLYSVYSPLTSNNKLYRNYIEITGDTSQSINSIRSKYNKDIFNGFLNETVIKTSFINKYCINLSPKKTVTIFELNSGNSRADICMINDESFVYEIKTEFDTLNRLYKLLVDYKKIFDHISIIIPENLLDSILNEIDSSIGIILYKQNRVKRVSFRIFRDSKTNDKIEPLTQLQQLTKNQLVQIRKKDEPKDILINHILSCYSKSEINNLYKSNIKSKYRKQWEFLINNKNSIEPLDYQWFFQNNISSKIVYK